MLPRMIFKNMNAHRFFSVFLKCVLISFTFLLSVYAWAIQCEVCNLEIQENQHRIRNGNRHYHNDCYRRHPRNELARNEAAREAEGAAAAQEFGRDLQGALAAEVQNGQPRRMEDGLLPDPLDRAPLTEADAVTLLDLARTMPLGRLRIMPMKEFSCEDAACCVGGACATYCTGNYCPLMLPMVHFFDKSDYNTAAENANAVVMLVGAASDRLNRGNEGSLRNDYLRIYLTTVGDGTTGWLNPKPTYKVAWTPIEIDVLAARIILAYSGSRFGNTGRSVWGNHYYYTPIQIIQELARIDAQGQYLIKTSTLKAEAEIWKDTPGVKILPRY